MNVHLNVRTPKDLVKEIDKTVEGGYYKNRTEAINDGMKLVVRQKKLLEIEEKMRKIRLNAPKGGKTLSDLVNESREEEDRRL